MTDAARAADTPEKRPAALLGVEHSALGRRWVERTSDDRLSMTLAQRLGVSEIVARILSARGISAETAEEFLNPTLRTAMPAPNAFTDMERAAQRLGDAITHGERIVVFGDYDVDGATSSAVLHRAVKGAGGDIGIYIPDRLSEGYGPNPAAMRKLAEEGTNLVVTVDCGTTAFEALEAAAGAGLDVIVVDHHEAETKLPRALAVVNPKRIDGGTPDEAHLAAVGLTFILAAATYRALRSKGWFEDRDEPDLLGLLDIVALGTVCDMVPLTGINRAFVHQGLKILSRRANPGLSALADAAGVDESPGTYHLGFVFGPRINAGGRVGESSLGATLLSTNDPAEASTLARRLDALNRERQMIEAEILEDAMRRAEALVAARDPAALVIAGENWHPGVIGIVASRLKDAFNRPTCVVALNDGAGTGSGRSVAGVDLGQTVIAARQSGLLTKGGGHMMAAGFSLDAEKLEDFSHFLEKRIAQQMTASGFYPTQTIDGHLKVAAATAELIDLIASIGPFGTANPEPRFALAGVRLQFADIVGENHVKCRLEDDSRGRLDGICFRSVGTPLGELLLHRSRPTLHIAGKLRLNTWQGRSTPQIIIDDAALA
ncbi:MAG: single-stranded-DNA-specific exonuclease RecJ [Rhodospirillales bacterium]